MKIIRFAILILGLSASAQVDPHLEFVTNVLCITNFESSACNNSGDCSSGVGNVACASWGFEVNTPKVFKSSCVEIDLSQQDDILNAFCGMEFRGSYGNTGYTQKLKAIAKNLTPGMPYDISFQQRNLGNDLGFAPPSAGNLKNARFKVTFGGTALHSDVMNYNETTGEHKFFYEQTLTFIAPQGTDEAVLIIAPAVPAGYTGMVVTQLAIDNIEITRGKDELDVDPPIIEVVTVPIPCVNCTSFELSHNEKYVISGWVRVTNMNEAALDAYEYKDVSIVIQFPQSDPFQFFTQGEIIDGWQRISGEFVVPETATEIFIKLQNDTSEYMAFFDDIRVHPFNGNLKSFVYDQATQKLMAELDENNYATFFEYDKEGGLIRVKKETEKGVFTIQESRSSNPKN